MDSIYEQLQDRNDKERAGIQRIMQPQIDAINARLDAIEELRFGDKPGTTAMDAFDRGREYERKAILDHIRTLAFDCTDDLVEQIENGRHRNK